MWERLSFEGIVAEHRGFIRRTLASLGVRGSDLDDVSQAVLWGIDQGLRGFDPRVSARPESALRGWIFGICERQAASHRRLERKRAEVVCAVEGLDRGASAGASAEERLIERERSEHLLRLVAGIDPARRGVLVAYELEEMSMAEVAAALRIPVNTAWNRLRLAREELRAVWARVGGHAGV